MGLVVVGFGLLDIPSGSIFLRRFCRNISEMFHGISIVEVTVIMLTFGMGASSQAFCPCRRWYFHQGGGCWSGPGW